MARARRFDAVLAHPATNVGSLIAETYTPEEKARFELAVHAQALRVGFEERDITLLPLAESAGMVDLESQWRRESMEAQSRQTDPRFVALQSQRGLYGELGRELEAYAAKIPGRQAEGGALVQAAEAYIAEGDMDSQVRVMRQALARNALSGVLLDRYLALMAQRQPEALLAVVRGNPFAETRNRAVQFAIAGERAPLAYSAVQARGGALAPVWTKAYTALAGQYFNDRAPAIDAAFQGALDTRTIGERLRVPLKPAAVIVGSVWFYYGARYGDYLATGNNPAADAWLPASLEAAPGNPGAYMALGDSLAEAGQGARAITRFEQALALDPDRGDAHSHIARVLWSEGRKPEAIARWKSALAVFLRIQGRGVSVPEPFWARVAETFTDIGGRHAIGELRGEIAHLLGDYYQINKEYRLSELIEPAARASVVSGEGTAWLVELCRSMDNPYRIEYELMRVPELTDAQRVSLQRDLVAALAKRAEASFGDNREYGGSQATYARLELITMLLNAGDVKGAAAEWSQIPATKHPISGDVEIRLASKTGGLEALLERYRLQPENAPSVEDLRNAAMALRRDGEENGARSVLEFLYDRELRAGDLEAANFIGLAEVKLQRNDTAAALGLLNRMALVLEDGFDTFLPAAELLGKYGKTAEAADFIRRRIKAVPWDSAAKVQLARTMPAGAAAREPLLSFAVNDAWAAYPLRAEAARLSAPHPLAGTAGTELALLASRAIAPDAAAKPYQVEARMEAAREAADPEVKLRLWREALALAPADERVRLGALRAALALRRDSLALALEQGRPQGQTEYNAEVPYYNRRGRYSPHRPPGAASILPQTQLTDPERATLAESLAAAAERVDDLNSAQSHLRAAIDLRAAHQNEGERAALVRHLNQLVAEQDRRVKNAARQPVIKNVIEQDQRVRPRIPRRAQ